MVPVIPRRNPEGWTHLPLPLPVNPHLKKPTQLLLSCPSQPARGSGGGGQQVQPFPSSPFVRVCTRLSYLLCHWHGLASGMCGSAGCVPPWEALGQPQAPQNREPRDSLCKKWLPAAFLPVWTQAASSWCPCPFCHNPGPSTLTIVSVGIACLLGFSSLMNF